MKSLSLVGLVLSLVGMFAYGYETGYWENNPSYPKTWTSDAVGIGTDSPEQMLHIKSSFPKIVMESNSCKWWMYARPGDNSFRISDLKNDRLSWFIVKSEIATFGDPSSAVGISIIGGEEKVRDLDFCTGDYNHPRWVLRAGQEPESGNDTGSDFTIISRKDDGSWKSACLHIKRNTGNVGIGTTNPGDYKLAVNGTIRAKEIKVETGWSDFVFADNYKLMPLNKLEKYIKRNKSLPGIPSEKEVFENGVELGEMQAKFLEKIEELTLYVIEQNKKIYELEDKIARLEAEN